MRCRQLGPPRTKDLGLDLRVRGNFVGWGGAKGWDRESTEIGVWGCSLGGTEGSSADGKIGVQSY